MNLQNSRSLGLQVISINLWARADLRELVDRVLRQLWVRYRAGIVDFAAGRSEVILEKHALPGGIGLSLRPSIEKMRLMVDQYLDQS